MDELKKNIREWEKEYIVTWAGKECRVKVLEPSGFTSFKDWQDGKFTKLEFEEGVMFSIVMIIPLKG